MAQQHPRLNYNRRAHIIHTRDILGAPSTGDQEECTTEPHKTPTT